LFRAFVCFLSFLLSLRNLCIYSTSITFVLRYVIGLILDLGSGLNHLIVHSYEYLLLRSCLGCIPWHYSPSFIDPRYMDPELLMIFGWGIDLRVCAGRRSVFSFFNLKVRARAFLSNSSFNLMMSAPVITCALDNTCLSDLTALFPSYFIRISLN
jgi:hypothetical protein